MNPPHLLLAASNCRKLRNNLEHLLDPAALAVIDAEIARNARLMFRLGREHYRVADRLPNNAWRHAISRFYYGAYHVGRSIRFFVDGSYSTDVSDHKKFTELPVDFPKLNTYSTELGLLRDNRNLCDYDHEARASDLVLTRRETRDLVTAFIEDGRQYLTGRGLAL